ncbi:hypothetical protein DFJ73DRAFT_877051 [Zopfochytrium polystomum]|nr:hypothetical protein DFJ73DRAFT_877051 [Zopfochytrium polystomum]
MQLLQTALAAIAAYNAWNITDILAVRSPDCIHYVLPSSLNQPPRDNAAYAAYFSALMPLYKNFHVDVLDTAVDEQAKAVTVWAKSTADSVLGPYGNEYIMWFKMTDDGASINVVREYVDSAYSVDFFKRLQAFTAAAAGNSNATTTSSSSL